MDAMGGDHAPQHEVQGAIEAVRAAGDSLHVILVGQEERLRPLLTGIPESSISIVHAPDVVTMHDEPSTIVRSRQQSSLYVGVSLMKQGVADAFVSAGNTGAVMATSTMMCGRIRGVSRPTIGSFFPTATGRPTLVLDVGANVDSKPKFLCDYAVMGDVYARLILGIERPTVGLLNVGEEESKGTAVAQETNTMLKTLPINFIGNVEGRDILSGEFDIVVCDGFEGNIVLKFAESVLGFLKAKLKRYAERGLLQKAALALAAPILKGALKDMDYQEYGGVPLLGVNGVVIIGHGSSSPKAIANMVHRAMDVVQCDVNGHIERALNE